MVSSCNLFVTESANWSAQVFASKIIDKGVCIWPSLLIVDLVHLFIEVFSLFSIELTSLW